MISPEKLASILLENGWKDTTDAQHTKLQTEIIPAIASEVKVFVIYEIRYDLDEDIKNLMGFTFSETKAKEIASKNDWVYSQLDSLE